MKAWHWILLWSALLVACSSRRPSSGDLDAGATDDGMVLGEDAGSPPTGCDPSCTAAGGTCDSARGVCSIVENPYGIDAATQAKLEAGGAADPAFRWLYPYDRTVFPRGLLAPTMQFAGGSVDAFYVHVTSANLDFKGFYSRSIARVYVSSAAWTAITNTSQSRAALSVNVAKIAAGAVTGPITESWTVAPGTIRGTLYYETYGSKIIDPSNGGVGIMKIKPGALAPTIVQHGCGNVCHSASADGSTLVASATSSNPNTMNAYASASYDLKNAASIIGTAVDRRYAYGGLYPDGSFFMSATNYRLWDDSPSRLFDTKTAAPIAAPGWDGQITNGGTAAFSPDGKHIAFVHEDEDQGHTLATMTFDVKTKTFASLADLATHPNYVAWPAFTPDSASVVYHAGSSAAFETDYDHSGDLYAVDLATKTIQRLDSADGYVGSGTQSYLPNNDPALSFAPTVLPIAVGGYYWVVFTTHRSWGNVLGTKQFGDLNGQLWISALDLDGKPGVDPSHPAIRLEGQEIDADNLRGFWVLDPCKENGKGCSSGDECCSGFCRSQGNDPPVCSPAQGCAREYERCETASDCCSPRARCIDHFCAGIPPN